MVLGKKTFGKPLNTKRIDIHSIYSHYNNLKMDFRAIWDIYMSSNTIYLVVAKRFVMRQAIWSPGNSYNRVTGYIEFEMVSQVICAKSGSGTRLDPHGEPRLLTRYHFFSPLKSTSSPMALTIGTSSTLSGWIVAVQEEDD
jgi:hypothetical protein